MRLALSLVLAVHGLIHLLGFLKSWKLVELPQLSGATLFVFREPYNRLVGALWLLPFLAFNIGVYTLFSRFEQWWIVVGVGLLISQILVIYSWPDAKAGTIVNILLLLPVVVGWADARFQSETDQKIQELFNRAQSTKSKIVTFEDLATLPLPVKRWLIEAGVVGKTIPRTVRLRQRGMMRISPDQEEVEATAQQYFLLEKPEFIWRVRLWVKGILPISGRDTYREGRGRMTIKLASLITVVDATDDKIHQGALLRYLGESIWMPAAMLNKTVRWEPINDKSAKATMTHGGTSGSAIFTFDDKDRFIRLTAERFYGGGPDAKLEQWDIEATDWDTMGGYLVPVRGEVRWKLPDGDFTFYRWEITEIDYDPLGLFAAG